MAHLVIIGNGITGITTARHVRKRADLQITVISAETEYFYSRPALMYIYMGHMRYQDIKPYEDWFWQKNRIDLIRSYVTAIDTDSKTVHLETGRSLAYDKLVIATGSQSNKFGWPGQDLPGVQGLYGMQDLELMQRDTAGINRAVVVGGGLIGVEMAEMLCSRKIPVTFLVREKFYWDNILPEGEASLVARHVRSHGIDLRLQTELQEILPGKNGRVRAVVTNKGEEINCEFVGLTAGVHPNIQVVKNSKIAFGKGVLVDEYFETNIADIYAAGDCAEIKATAAGEKNRLEQLWYTGRLQAMALAKTLGGERTKYERGVWFNSAKFFDIEYQTYGLVSNEPRAGERSFYWEHAQGQRCLRIVYEAESGAVIGFNLLGMRFRHEVCDYWIREKRAIDEVMENLREANFAPEFFKTFEPEILAAYQRQNPNKRLQLKHRRNFFEQIFPKGFSRGASTNPATLSARP